jgi:nitroreductase
MAQEQDIGANPTLKTIFSRASVRSFKNAPVPKEALDTAVRAAMAAPTAVDKRPWEFIVITDRATLDRLAAALPYAKMASQAGAAIVVCGDTERQHGGTAADFWVMDCSAASENILLAVGSLGLGAVWTSVYPDPQRVKAVRSILGIPEHIVPLNLIPIGVPEGTPQPKDKYNPRQIHWEKW